MPAPSVLVWSLLACQDAAPARAPPADADTVPPGSAFAPDNPLWSAAEAADALATALAPGLPDSTVLGTTYAAAIALRDDSCPSTIPGSTEEGVGPWRADACTTAGGTTFDGEVSESTDTTDDGDGGTIFAQLLGGEGTISDADGVGYHHSGQANLTCTYAADGAVTWEGSFSGNFAAAWGEGWLVEGGLASVFMEGQRGDEAAIQLFGGVRTGDVVLHFKDLALAGCGLTGELRVQDPTGYWWRLQFEPDTDTCDACGALSWEGRDGGELCLGETLLAPLTALAEGTCS